MTQTKLPFAKNSATSRAAAKSMESHAPSIRDQVYRLISASGERGRTCDEIEDIFLLIHQTCSARIRELSKAGRIHDSGRTRKTRSGRKATVYIV